jgi:putative transposase
VGAVVGVPAHPRRAGRPGQKLAAPAVWQILKDAGIDPAPTRSGQAWRAFLDAQAKTILAADLFHVGTVFLRRLHVLFFIAHGTRRVHLAGITAHPAAEWVIQQARNLLMSLDGHADSLKFLIRDRDAKFTAAFGAVFTAADVRIIKMPVQAPRANAIARRRIASARRECLDRMLVTGERHLRLVLSQYADHYNGHRPHRALQQEPARRAGASCGCRKLCHLGRFAGNAAARGLRQVAGGSACAWLCVR